MENFGQYLREERKKRKISVETLSKMSGVSASAIYNLEMGRQTNPKQETIDKLLSALGIKQNGNERDDKPVGFRMIGKNTDIGIIVTTKPSDNADLSLYDFESPLIKEEILKFIDEHKEEIVNKFVGRIREEVEKRHKEMEFVIEKNQDKPTD
ncbi:helix-turn-helix domain-containing protein [Brevibacillus agri]|uniref:helix-turn-helix domain-containing protein n=1 Tax=Brevibacillus agri TaxID=51101 RepID=UPI0025B6E1E2|nr:transcriptional regulator [Brevibacillus agri]MDN4093593.1 helix-turn-helix domain-containing protein [Brevibacillus agri]